MLLFGVCGGWLQVPLDYSYFAVFIGHSSYLQSSDRSTMPCSIGVWTVLIFA
jgi:hypothetical protein